MEEGRFGVELSQTAREYLDEMSESFDCSAMYKDDFYPYVIKFIQETIIDKRKGDPSARSFDDYEEFARLITESSKTMVVQVAGKDVDPEVREYIARETKIKYLERSMREYINAREE